MLRPSDMDVVRRAIDGGDVSEEEMDRVRAALSPTSVDSECTGCRREKDPRSKSRQADCQRCWGTGNEPLWLTVTVWACLCGNYYASSSAGNLAEQMRTDVTGQEERGSRSRCPNCKSERTPVDVAVNVPIK